jgi:hypothetical protein
MFLVGLLLEVTWTQLELSTGCCGSCSAPGCRGDACPPWKFTTGSREGFCFRS